MGKKSIILLLPVIVWMLVATSHRVGARYAHQASGILKGGEESQQALTSTHSVIIAAVLFGLLLGAIVALLLKDRKIWKLTQNLDEANRQLVACNEVLATTNDQLEASREKLLESQEALKLGQHHIEKELQEAQVRLEHAYNSLQKSHEEFDAFSYSISHDLRAPLRAINGYSAILVEEHGEKLDDSAKKALMVIQQNSNRMDDLISDLLELARLGTIAVSKQKFNMHKVIESVLYHTALKTNTQFQVAPMDDVVADSGLMRQVWENLIGNAVKFSSKTDIPKIEIGHTRQNGEQVFWIKDNGVGFDAHYADKLFKVFSRLHSKKEFDGTGAGLAISKKIIDAHGGRIWAEAQLSKGATFYFTLPMVGEKQETPIDLRFESR